GAGAAHRFASPGRRQATRSLGGDLQQVRSRLRPGETPVARLPGARSRKRLAASQRGGAVCAEAVEGRGCAIGTWLAATRLPGRTAASGLIRAAWIWLWW